MSVICSKRREVIYGTMDGNEAVARVAYFTNEVIAIYPITPASPMGEYADRWSSEGRRNAWGTVPRVVEMQSEAGAIAAVHGAIQTGALATTFTASQGLLLMIPNMYKIAGELTPLVIHVAARSVASHALSIFCDHSDVMAVRPTGFVILSSASVQEAQDFALVSQVVSLRSRLPFVHFFDGFRTSHEVSKIELLGEDEILSLIPEESISRHRERALSPDRPKIRGTAQNPDVFFQSREVVNPFYRGLVGELRGVFREFQELTGRGYAPYEYVGHREAERVIVVMGSAAETVEEVVRDLSGCGERVGLVKVRLFHPFSVEDFVGVVPESVVSVAVLDRTKESGSVGEPLYLNCLHAFSRSGREVRLIGGRYGLSSKEFTPGMVKGILDHLSGGSLKHSFTVGIEDDVSHTSLEYPLDYCTEPEDRFQALFYGLGSDGTVGANKNTIKIIGQRTGNYVQGYFVYDSKKAGQVTISHLRFGDSPIYSRYLIQRADFIACHQQVLLWRYDMLSRIREGGIFLLNTTWSREEIWKRLPEEVQEAIVGRGVRFFAIDAYGIARRCGIYPRINTIMQICFFKLAGILPLEEALEAVRESVRSTYRKKGEEVVRRNLMAVEEALGGLFEVEVEADYRSGRRIAMSLPERFSPFVREVIGPMMEGRGDSLKVSQMPVDGTFPTGTSCLEKRGLALEIPVWEPEVCIQCGKCALVCPHGVIRIKVYDREKLAGEAPEGFKSVGARDRNWRGLEYTIQVSPEDCTGCRICVEVCPAQEKEEPFRRALRMEEKSGILEKSKNFWEYFLQIPDLDRSLIRVNSVRQQQVQCPLFEFSGACSGCGETPYLKLISQLFGDRLLVANATGCSSIYGGNLPTTPWTRDGEGRGPAWSNSLFEDNGEFGMGFRVSLDKQVEYARELLRSLAQEVGEGVVEEILSSEQRDEVEIYAQRRRVEELRRRLEGLSDRRALRLLDICDLLVRKSVWIVGGDGWAYDIGFGGLDHLFSSGLDVNILVLDTEVYSNTGGQRSKSTPLGAVARFAAGGKEVVKKDLGLMAITYGDVYVASVAMGARDEHTLRSFLEAESYRGVSLIIAYSHCIEHGIEMAKGMESQRLAVQTGQWLLYRYDPRLEREGRNPLSLALRNPKLPLEEYFSRERRFQVLAKESPERYRLFLEQAQRWVERRFKFYRMLEKFPYGGVE